MMEKTAVKNFLPPETSPSYLAMLAFYGIAFILAIGIAAGYFAHQIGATLENASLK